MPVRIVIGVDASMGARAAVRALDARAWRAGTEIRVVGADETVAATGTISLVPTAAAWVKESNDAELTEIRAGLEDAARHLLNAGLLVSTRIKKGSAADVLKDEARAWDADCIVVGWRRSNSERVRAGSVARALVSTAPCTVEIVRSHGRE